MKGKEKSMLLKEQIHYDAKKKVIEYRNSPKWLQNGIHFDISLRLKNQRQKNQLNNFYETLNIKGYRGEDKLRALEILYCNLLVQKRKPLEIYLNRNNWKKTRYTGRALFFIPDLVRILFEKGLINMRKGFNAPIKKSSRMTRIWATDKLLDAFPILPKNIISEPVEVIVLKDWEGHLLEYKDTAKTYRMRAILERVNKVNSKSDIRYKEYKLSTSLHAIFIESFSLYGRMHSRGYMHYQGLSGYEREDITINGNPVVELDFSALHPNLLYAKEGIQYPLDKDPYAAIDDKPKLRPFFKQVLLRLLNSKDVKTAKKAIDYWFYLNQSEAMALSKTGYTRETSLLLIETFQKVHAPISNYFCSGKKTGLQIMNKDAQIALSVIGYFARKNIPILSIHDSFMIEAKYKHELYLVMKNKYAQYTKNTENKQGYMIKIK